MVAAFPPSEGLPLDRAPDPAVAEVSAAGLRRRVITDLARLITDPAEGVSALDRVEAVRLLGQLGGPLARLTLAGVLRAGPRLSPPAVGRWLRDTALDTLLRDPDRAATDRLLTAYYRLDRRLLRGRLERNLVYDDIPTLLAHHRAGALVRGYLLPLLATLLALVIVPEVIYPLIRSVPGHSLLGFVALISLGLGLFNLHQVGLILLVAWAGSRLPLLHIERRAIRVAWAVALAGLAFLFSLLGVLLVLASISTGSPDLQMLVQGCIWGVPLLILPCYMLAHDLETDVQNSPASSVRVHTLAVALRWGVGLLYIVYVTMAIGLSFLQVSRNNPNSVPGEDAVYLGIYPSIIYLALSPVLALLGMAALGWVQRRVQGRSRPVGVAR